MWFFLMCGVEDWSEGMKWKWRVQNYPQRPHPLPWLGAVSTLRLFSWRDSFLCRWLFLVMDTLCWGLWETFSFGFCYWHPSEANCRAVCIFHRMTTAILACWICNLYWVYWQYLNTQVWRFCIRAAFIQLSVLDVLSVAKCQTLGWKASIGTLSAL